MKIGWKYSVAAVLLLIPFFYAMWFTFPVGDDFARSNEAKHLFDLFAGLHEMGRAWWKWSGRYTHHFLVVFLGNVALSREAYALTCTALALLYLTSLYGIFSTIQGKASRRESAFFAFFCLLAVYCGHQSLGSTFYLVTDILSLGIANGFVLMFIWALCRLWFSPAVTRGAVAFPVISGVIAIGCYEHSALATLLTAAIAFGLARLYNHPYETAFRRVLLWIGVFFLLSSFCRGNFRRQTKRGATSGVIFEQLGAAGGDWLAYGFQLFSGVFPIAAVAVGVLARPRWKTSLGFRLSIPKVLLLGALAYVLLSGGLVLIHAVSDVTIGATPKLPASLALLGSYLLAFLALACGDGPRRLFARLPAWIVVPPLLAALCATPNMRRTAQSLINGETAAFAATQERRYAWLASGAARDSRPTVVEPLDVFPFPAGHEAFQPEPDHWPNKHVAEMFGLSGIRVLPLDARAALEKSALENVAPDPAAKERGRAVRLPVPAGLQALGVQRIALVRGLAGGPNPTFVHDWLFVSASGSLPSFTTLTLAAPGAPRLIPVFAQRWLGERALSRAVLAPDDPCVRLAGVVRRFSASNRAAVPGSAGVYGLPVHNPAAGAFAGLYLGIGDGDLHRILP